MGTIGFPDSTVAIMRAAIITISVYWLISGNALWFIVGAVSVALTLLPTICLADRVMKNRITLIVSGFLCAHILLGMQAGLYETSVWFDKGLHVFSCGAISGVLVVFIPRWGERRRILIPASVNWTLAVGVAVSLGTLWEVFEFAIDHTGLFYSQRGLADTMFDLIADTIGATAVASLGIVFAGRRTPAVP